MRERRRSTIRDLRLAIDCMPRQTRIAMLEGLETNPIIAGAYSNHDGICPMLAAHRAGGRTDFVAFARAWDRYAFRGARRRLARRATERELLVLRSHLEASLLADGSIGEELAAAWREHQVLQSRSRLAQTPSRPRPGDPDRSPELRQRNGWSWMRVMRRYDEYERALAQLQAGEASLPACSMSSDRL
jgi:hypothetical protein